MYSITQNQNAVYGEVFTYRHFLLGTREFSVLNGDFFPTNENFNEQHPFDISESSNGTIWFQPRRGLNTSEVRFVINNYTIYRYFSQAGWIKVNPIPGNTPDGPSVITHSSKTGLSIQARLLVAFTKEDITFFDGQDVSVEEFCIINPETLDFPSQWESEITKTYRLYKHLKGE